VMKNIIVVITLLFAFNQVKAQDKNTISGTVSTKEKGKLKTLIGANVFWLNTQVGTTTNANGQFTIDRTDASNTLVISFVGYQADTMVNPTSPLKIVLGNDVELSEVEIVKRQKTTRLNSLDPKKTENISSKELLKAACCNLSESFETNPSVDIAITDAVTGTKQIQMLGLAGPYTQIMRENLPDVRGISAMNGLTFTPGPWIESIQLNKGTGSVVNGYESMAGQINVNLKNPSDMPKLFLNTYANAAGRQEANANIGLDVGNRWGTAVLLHANRMQRQNDVNKDGFLDSPIGEQYIILNRWERYSDNGLHLQFGIKAGYLDKTGGQKGFSASDENKANPSLWGSHVKSERYEGWLKIGKVNQEKPYQSFGFQASALEYKHHAAFGLRTHNADQNSLYTNFIFQSIIGNTNHKYKVGASFQGDWYTESLSNPLLDNSGAVLNFNRNELVPGVFGEYTLTPSDKFNVVLGLRGDYHNLYGAFVTPRLHARYAFTPKTIFRLAAGRGARTANVVAENMGLLASSRAFIINNPTGDLPYGLKQERSWNYGFNITQDFRLWYRDGYVTLDAYRTDFTNQVVVDLDEGYQQINFYNLDGKSYSNSLQLTLDYEVIRRLDLKIAYRYVDVKTTYNGVLKQKPLVSKNRAFATLTYTTKNAWSFDGTYNIFGKKRFTSSLADNPSNTTYGENSPIYSTVNAQVSKSWKEVFDVYAGVENLFNKRQKTAIIDAENPFGNNLDATQVWGPIFGRNIYLGLRYTFK